MESDTLRGIDSVLARINTHPEYSAIAARDSTLQLRSEAERHSLEIEFKSSGYKFKEHIGLTKGTLLNLNEAWNYLAASGLDTTSVSRLGYLIDPANNKQSGFRRTEIQFGGFAPAGPSEVPHLIENLVAFLNATKHHPVTRATNAHLE